MTKVPQEGNGRKPVNWWGIGRALGLLVLGAGGTAGAVIPATVDRVESVRQEKNAVTQEASGYKDAFETVLEALEKCRETCPQRLRGTTDGR